MAQLNHLVICENFITDEVNKTRNILGIFNRLITEKLPTRPPRMVLAFSFCPEEADVTDQKIGVKFVFRDPDGELLLEVKGDVELSAAVADMPPDEREVTGAYDASEMAMFKKDGAHKLEFFVNNKRIGYRCLNVILIEGGEA